jgi:hypothetical protein
VWYESRRAGLETELVLGLIQVESGFRKYAISSAGARGYMQVMPFWSRLIGDGDVSRLFHMQTNLRFGCTILRHYLDIERGDLFLALGRYNGSRGRSPYPDARRLLDAGLTVAISTDCNPGSSYTSSMAFCVALAVREMHMTVAEALWAATAGGALALRRTDVGRLAVGSRADIVELDAPTFVHLAYRPGVPLTRRVWKNGVAAS